MDHTEDNTGLEIMFAVTVVSCEGALKSDDVVRKANLMEMRLANHRSSSCKAGLSSNDVHPSIIRAS